MYHPKTIERLRRARSVAVLTGAGISAESGIPTFRSPEGLWARFKPEELANVKAFLRNPELVWSWYEHRRRVAREAQPNAAHLALVALEERYPDFTLITQNVDNLHRRAGSRNVVELHGNIERNRCVACQRPWVEPDTELKEPPRCAHCGELVRPDVVWFGEPLPEEAWMRAEAAARRAEVFLVIGTSAVVYPAAWLPEIAWESGAYTVEINLEPTALSDRVHDSVRERATAALVRLLELLG
ncbi:MAG: NAD-dependent deacylase [Bacteroidetes bacterium]|nr:NAD-dependent deacylase [Bacteroidota bacterium]